MRSRTHRRPTARLVLVAALLIGAGIVWQSSYAVFVAKADNPGNAWYTGGVHLATQNGSGGSMTGVALFNATGLVPGGSIAAHCVTVDYTGTVAPAAAIHVYAKDTTNSAAVNAHTLASYLTLKIEEGTGSTDTNCTGFAVGATVFDTTNRAGATSATVIAGSLIDFTTNSTGYATARLGAWTPAAAPPTTSRSYRFTVTFPGSAVFPGTGNDTVDSDLMDMSAVTTFVWEVRS